MIFTIQMSSVPQLSLQSKLTLAATLRWVYLAHTHTSHISHTPLQQKTLGKYEEDPTRYTTLQVMMTHEIETDTAGTDSATESLLWLKRWVWRNCYV